jgi:predicted metal-dependent peptidase
MAVTKKHIVIYNPKMVVTVGFEEIAGVLIHELHHILRNHLSRIDDLPWKPDKNIRANIAADLTINDGLLSSGWALPPGGVLCATFKFPTNQALETYYTLLSDEQVKENDPKCGGVAGNPSNIEQEVDSTFEEIPQLIREQSVRNALHEIQQAAESRNAGRLPKDLLKEIPEFLKPARINWRTQLRHMLRSSCGTITTGGTDFTRRIPNKSALARGVCLPSTVAYTPEVCFILDTSGSMSEDVITDVLIEAYAILKAFSVRHAWLLHADTQVHKTERLRLDKPKALKAVGRGGTSFDAPLQVSQQLKPTPDIVIYLTDGEGKVTYKPRSKLVWVVCNKNSKDMPIGMTVHIT